MFTDLEQSALLNEILDEGEINEYNSDGKDSDCDDYMQLVLSGISALHEGKRSAWHGRFTL
jgi:hypothetical protein